MQSLNTRKIMLLFCALFFYLASIFFATSAALSSGSDTVEFDNIEADVTSTEMVTIEWLTNVPTEGKVIFGTEEDNLKYFVIDASGENKYHKIEIGNLKADTRYYYRVVVINTYEETQSFTRMFDTNKEKVKEGKAPGITDVRVAYVSGLTAVITWETDEDADSVVYLDESKTYKHKFSNSQKTTLHRVVIKNLKPNTEYFARLTSTDKNKNSSGYYYLDFKTRINDNMDKEDFKITNLRPAGPSDSQISTIFASISFKTNHWAKGSITLSGKGIRTKKINLDYNDNFFAAFTGLDPGTEYTVKISMVDVFGKKQTEDFKITTKAITDSQKQALIEQALNFHGDCLSYLVDTPGFFAQYYNLDINAPNLLLSEIKSSPRGTGWFDTKYLAQSRIDADINFGRNFLPLDQGKAGDPYFFSVYWQGFFEITKTAKYTFKVTADDDAWVYIDGQLAVDDSGLKTSAKSKSAKPELTAGWHKIEIYFTQRQNKGSQFSFSYTKGLEFHPLPPGCSWLPGFEDYSGDTCPVVVAGIEYLPYTPASALLKTADSPKVWAIVNGQRYYIASAEAFNEYGYRWDQVRTVGWAEIVRFPQANLVKSPDSPAVYYLYERPGGRQYKVKIPTPAAFNSYPGNQWGKIVTISREDLSAIPDIPLVKTAGNPAVYRLVNGRKQLLSQTDFYNDNLNADQIGVVSQVHLDSFN